MLTTRFIEAWAPLGLAFVCAGAWFWLDAAIAGSFSKELLAALLSVAAISAGFLTTALSILLPIGSTETGRKLQRNGFMPGIHLYLRRGVLGCLAWAGVCLTAFFFLPDPSAPMAQHWSTAIVFFTAYATASLVRIAEILLNIFERMSDPDDKQG